MVKRDYFRSDDIDLVKWSLEDDNRAFGEIIRRYEGKIARTVKGMVGDIQLAEDIGQETFVKLYYSLKEFRGEASLATYIHRIAINLSLNEIKKKKRSSSLFYISGRNEKPAESDVASDDQENAVDAREVVQKALSKLDDEFRSVVVLRLIHGYSTRETAEILELPLGTVLSRLSRAKEQLRNILDKLI